MTPAGTGFLQSLADPRLVFTDLQAKTLEEALTEMSSRLAQAGAVKDAADLARRLLEREKLGPTALGSGIAIPHCKLKEVSDVVLAVGVSSCGVDFHASDGIPVNLFFLILSPADAPALHLQALAHISRVLRKPEVAESLRRAGSPEAIVETLREAEGHA